MALTLTGNTVEITEEAVEEFRSRLRGDLIGPGDSSYDEARAVWNAMIDRRPALIAKCAGAADIMAAVRFAREHELLTSVRGGGHNVAGNAVCDDGLVIDLSSMRSVRVDPARRRVRVEPGTKLGDLDHEAQAQGLAVPAGIVTTTGVAGLTLGGGLGWLSRRWGLTCDNLVSADVVTAEGTLVRASENENGELFWGLRGGGGNFGIVSSFEFQAHEFGPIAACGIVLHPMSEARAVLEFFREFTSTASDGITLGALLRLAPAAPFLPPEVHGAPVIGLAGAYAGPHDEGMEALAPIKEFGSPIADLMEPKPFVLHQSMFDAGQPHGGYYYWKSHYFDELSDEAIGAIVSGGEAIRSPMSILATMHLGGAVAAVGEQDTAYSNRAAPYVMNVNGSWSDPAENERHTAWVRDTYDSLVPYATGSAFLNFVAESGLDQVLAIYGEEKYRRLQRVKDAWDPTNLFRLNQNIKPTGS